MLEMTCKREKDNTLQKDKHAGTACRCQRSEGWWLQYPEGKAVPSARALDSLR